MERGNIWVFLLVRLMIIDENCEDGDGGKMMYLFKGMIYFFYRFGLCKCVCFLSYVI